MENRFRFPPPPEDPAGHHSPEKGDEGGGLEIIQERTGFVPDPKQALVLASQKKRIILNCSRQWGKSSVLAARAVRMLIAPPESAVRQGGALVLVVARTLAQAGETMRKIERFLKVAGHETRGEAGKTLAMRLGNGSRVVGVAAEEDKVRSYTADMVILDEAARIPDDVWGAIEPTLATTDGDLVVASTPEGKRGMFWEVWTNGGPEWLKVQATVHECPRISKEFIEAQRKKPSFVQEYECGFVDSSRYLISRESVERLITSDEKALR